MSTQNIIPITKINVYPVKNSEGRLRGIARIVLNDCMVLTNLRIYDGSSGLFVSHPIEKIGGSDESEFRQIFYPLTRSMREYVESEVLKEYHSVIQAI